MRITDRGFGVGHTSPIIVCVQHFVTRHNRVESYDLKSVVDRTAITELSTDRNEWLFVHIMTRL